MRSISVYIFSGALLLLSFLSLQGQDTLRTYGPRVGIDVAPFVSYFADPPIRGAEVSLDFEIAPNFYPVFELGFSSMSDSIFDVTYSSTGSYARIGLDYNLLPLDDRSVHHSITAGFRYGVSLFKHEANNILIPGEYWGDYLIESYENNLTGHWLELVGGIKAEVLPNFFLGWTIRYRILFNQSLDEQLSPLHIPGYGNGAEKRGMGFSYTLSYKIPILKK